MSKEFLQIFRNKILTFPANEAKFPQLCHEILNYILNQRNKINHNNTRILSIETTRLNDFSNS